MKKVYLLTAARNFGATGSKISASGSLNRALAEVAEQVLRPQFDVTAHNIADGFDISEERKLLTESDIVILQFPVYWFSAPHYLKQYMDEVYIGEQFWSPTRDGQKYGKMGRLSGRYMLSVTMNSPSATNYVSGLAEGRSVDEILLPIHLTQRYLGLQPVPTFHALNVYGSYDKAEDPAIGDHLASYRRHLTRFVSAG